MEEIGANEDCKFFISFWVLMASSRKKSHPSRMDWKKSLKEKLEKSNKARKSEEEMKAEEMAMFTKFYTERKGGQKDSNSPNIPRFYYRLPAEDEVLQQKLREESRAVFLQRKSRELLDNEELQNLWFLLDKHQSPPMIGEEAMINYSNFQIVGEKAGPKCKKLVHVPSPDHGPVGFSASATSASRSPSPDNPSDSEYESDNSYVQDFLSPPKRHSTLS
ncbi:unnamed protein product [Ranitomeya imitator]|uniref:Serine/threonine-protein phosphatase 2A regulatory subunit B'' subunit gamma n=1 Tax=Ranitomeya imitator TaxID=111125 RepID=A0ABN9L174_9NEOB|nr:unnamed protein product [Ranitomeya imitator]